MEIVIGIAVSILLAEAYVWLPSITKWLLNRAVSHVGAEERERCLEEWAANLNAIPNSLWRFVHVLSLFNAAGQINAETAEWTCDKIDEVLKHMVARHQTRVGRLQKCKEVWATGHTIHQKAEVTDVNAKVGRLLYLVSDPLDRLTQKHERIDSLFKVVAEKRAQLGLHGDASIPEFVSLRNNLASDINVLFELFEDDSWYNAAYMQEAEEIAGQLDALVAQSGGRDGGLAD